jgi:hypothetical protein
VSEQDDWGDMDEVLEVGAVPPRVKARSAGGGHDGRLTDIGLEAGAPWTGRGRGESRPAARLPKVREELVQRAGVARRLVRSFATRAEATQMAKAFVEDADPGRYVPGGRGRFGAMAVRNHDDGRWHALVRFVPEGPAAPIT